MVAVSDTGTGIDPADLERLFEPFERARDAHSPGTGLGLAISRAIMVLHGGRLEAESWPGVGSRFAAAFRVARLPHYTAEIDEAVAAQGPLVMGRGSVLLVEDDEAVAFSADRIGGTEERARAACDDFVLKPLRPRELLRRIGELVGG